MSINHSFQGFMACRGFISGETPDKIRFRQDYSDCWVKKKDIDKIQRLGKTMEGDVESIITVTEETANLLELTGVLE
jgi:hypothetical protein